jgi:hypothetical protein
MTVTAWESLIVGSAVDVANTVTLPGVGGAVYVVELPLAVCAGEKVPQLPTGVHDQSTPALLVSLVTEAIRGAPWPCTIVAFGTFCMIFTEIGRTIVTVT